MVTQKGLLFCGYTLCGLSWMFFFFGILLFFFFLFFFILFSYFCCDEVLVMHFKRDARSCSKRTSFEFGARWSVKFFLGGMVVGGPAAFYVTFDT